MRKRGWKQIIGMVTLMALASLFLYGLTSFRKSRVVQDFPGEPIFLPVGGNSWVINNIKETSEIVKDQSISGWTSKGDTINTYFYTDKTGELIIGLLARVPNGSSLISIGLDGSTRKLALDNTDFDTIFAGRFHVTNPGYQCIQMVGHKKSSREFAEVSHVMIGGEACMDTVHYVRDDFYFGKRGPSVHLSYTVPEEAGKVKWFYNEINIPKGEDVLGSYFMANGFAQGYFGIQVNSETERRILFSVWSPFHTDNPSEIPEDKRVVMLGKGKNVYTGQFGNEGSGGQSYLKYKWSSGSTYGFLLKGEPQGNMHTEFTAWFFAPELGQWQLIASFLRPDTDTHLMRLHSFLENFYTETGAISRRAHYSNQWICNTEGRWLELTAAKFTADATARKDARLDYSGGEKGDVFFLENCGFTNHHTEMNSLFERKASGQKPEIDFSALPYN